MKKYLPGIILLLLSGVCSMAGGNSQYLSLIEPTGGFYTNIAILSGLLWVILGIAGFLTLVAAHFD